MDSAENVCKSFLKLFKVLLATDADVSYDNLV